MRTKLPLAALLAFGMLAAGCGDHATTARADQRPGDPWGRDFLSTAVTEKGQARPLVAGSRIRLSFTDARGSGGVPRDARGSGGVPRDDGRLVASAGCNTMSGQAEVRDGRLVVADLATTEMGCDPERHAQDEWLARFLTSRPRFDLTGQELTISGGSTEIRLQDREVADPDRPLRGTRWVVDTIVDGEAASSAPSGADAHIILGDDNAFGGSTGCNSMGGTAIVDEGAGTITFSDVIATKIACEEDKMSLERAVLSVLDGKVTYTIEADRLTLSHPDSKGLVLRAAG